MAIRFKNKQFKFLLFEMHHEKAIKNIFLIKLYLGSILALLIIGLLAVFFIGLFLGCFTSGFDNDLDCISIEELIGYFFNVFGLFIVLNVLMTAILYCIDKFTNKKKAFKVKK